MLTLLLVRVLSVGDHFFESFVRVVKGLKVLFIGSMAPSDIQ